MTASATETAAAALGAPSSDCYLYAILDERPPIFGNDGELFVVDAAGLCAVAGPVPPVVTAVASALRPVAPAEVGTGAPDPGDAAVASTLEAAVRAHEEVVERLFAVSSLLPLRFGTVVRSVAAVEELLLTRADEIRAQLDAVRDRCEWGIKIDWRRRAAEATARADTGDPGPGGGVPGPGRSYLAARKRERLAAAALEAACRQRAQGLLSTLCGMSRAACRIGGLRAPEPDDGSEWPSIRILDGSFLVRRDDEGRFFDALEAAIERQGDLRASVSGPWPPYSFVVPVEVGR